MQKQLKRKIASKFLICLATILVWAGLLFEVVAKNCRRVADYLNQQSKKVGSSEEDRSVEQPVGDIDPLKEVVSEGNDTPFDRGG